jgi:hypothetical protein
MQQIKGLVYSLTYFPLKLRALSKLYGVTIYKITFFIVNTIRASNQTKQNLDVTVLLAQKDGGYCVHTDLKNYAKSYLSN